MGFQARVSTGAFQSGYSNRKSVVITSLYFWSVNHASCHALAIKRAGFCRDLRHDGNKKYAITVYIALEFHLALCNDGSFFPLNDRNLAILFKVLKCHAQFK